MITPGLDQELQQLQGVYQLITEFLINYSFQLIGAALVFPATLAILTNVFTDPTERAKAIDREGSFDRAVFKDVRDVYFGGDMEASLALAGQTVGLIHEVLPVADIIGRTVQGFHAIRKQQGERSQAGGF